MSQQDVSVGQVVTDGTGAVSATLGPVLIGTRWQLIRATCSSPEPGVSGELRLFRNSPGGAFIDGTSSPASDTSEYAAGAVVLHPGESIAAVWSDCTPDTPFGLVLSVEVLR